MGLSEATWEELRRAFDEVARRNSEKERQSNPRRKTIEVYVCPESDCPNYYGAAGMSDLEEEWTGLRGQNFEVLPEERNRTRADCIVCHDRGRGRVPMVRVAAVVAIPHVRPAPMTRPSSGPNAA